MTHTRMINGRHVMTLSAFFNWLVQNINKHQLINGYVHVVLLSDSLLFYESYILWMINERHWLVNDY